VSSLSWSPDGKALAILDDRAGVWKRDWYFRLLIWRSGEAVRVLDDVRPLKRVEGLLGPMRWSPDNRRLLLLGALTMGSFDSGMGDLWCFDTRYNRSSLLRPWDVTHAEWLTPTHLRITIGGESVVRDGVSTRQETQRTIDCRRTLKPDPQTKYPDGG
jgi:hypothetical protein